MSLRDLTPAELAQRDQAWADTQRRLDELLTVLRAHRPRCTGASAFCIGIEDGDPELANQMFELSALAMTSPVAVWMTYAAAGRLLDQEPA
jgi:hypothetical protein